MWISDLNDNITSDCVNNVILADFYEFRVWMINVRLNRESCIWNWWCECDCVVCRENKMDWIIFLCLISFEKVDILIKVWKFVIDSVNVSLWVHEIIEIWIETCIVFDFKEQSKQMCGYECENMNIWFQCCECEFVNAKLLCFICILAAFYWKCGSLSIFLCESW